MVINCNVPSFNNLTQEQKLKKMEQYLYELNDELRVILNNLELDNFTVETQDAINLSSDTKELIEKDITSSVEKLKQSILKTADEITQQLETTTTTLQGSITAVSNQLGQYTDDYFKTKVENALSTTETYQTITEINGQLQTSAAYIKTGNISDEIGTGTHYGIVIGDLGNSGLKVAIESGKMSFYENGKEIAYITGEELVISKVKIQDYIYFGHYRIEMINGITFTWEA